MSQIEELMLDTIDSDDNTKLSTILELLKSEKITADVLEALSMLIESYQKDSEKQPNKSFFITELPQFFTEDFPLLRIAFASAVKSFLSSDINKITAIKILGVRNKEFPLTKVYARYSSLKKLKKDQFFHNNLTKNWGITGEVDWIVGTINLLNFDKLLIQVIELESFLDNVSLFEPTEEIKNLFKIKIKPVKKEIVSILEKNACNLLDEFQIKNIILELLIPKVFSLEEFNIWWEQNNKENVAILQPQNARSLQELHNILYSSNGPYDQELTNAATLTLSETLNLIKMTSNLKDYLLWAECICALMAFYSEDNHEFLVPRDKQILDIVWPEKIEENSEISLGIWTQLKALNLSKWIKYTELVKGIDYLKNILLSLPWKVWPVLTGKLSTTFMESIIENHNKINSAEMLLWIWKNKSKLSSQSLKKLNYESVIFVVYRSRANTIWQIAPKELKKLLLENREFQMLLLKDDSESSVISFLEFLNSTTFVPTNDKQSMIIKFSRLSDKIRKILQSDEAKAVINSRKNNKVTETKDEYFITSIKSYHQKLAELKDIINRQIPENTEAIATARAHGDLRENAEFAAAKERQKFLNEHRILLESRLATTRPSDFSEIKVTDCVVVGSAVTLQYENKTCETFYILGIWDSDPAKKYVSYETDLGQTIMGKKVGERVILPGNKVCSIVNIESLPNNIIAELIE